MEITAQRRGTDDLLLEMLASQHADIQTIADVNGLTLVGLCTWANQPRIIEAIRGLRRLHRARAALLASESATFALGTLRTLANSIEDEERNLLPPNNPRGRAARARDRDTARRCSSELLRAAGHPRPRRSPPAPGPRRPKAAPEEPTLHAERF